MSLVLNVNVTCLACDGTRPCAQCRAAGKALVNAGHRVHHSSRYAALRAAEEGTYGFTACVVPLRAGERSIADAAATLLGDTSVALAVEDARELPSELPPRFVAFPLADYRAGKLPPDWLAQISAGDGRPGSPPDSRSTPDVVFRASEASSESDAAKKHATQRLRSVVEVFRPQKPDALALIADELAWYRASRVGFALLVIAIDDVSPASLIGALMAAMRAGDNAVARDHDCICVLAATDAKHARAIARRIAGAVSKRLGAARAVARLGVAHCPGDGEDPQILLARAEEEMR